MTNLTDKEKMVPQAMVDNEMNNVLDEPDYGVYTFAVQEQSRLGEQAFGGVLSSLIKKEYVTFSEFPPEDDEPSCMGATEKGLEYLRSVN